MPMVLKVMGMLSHGVLLKRSPNWPLLAISLSLDRHCNKQTESTFSGS